MNYINFDDLFAYLINKSSFLIRKNLLKKIKDANLDISSAEEFGLLLRVAQNKSMSQTNLIEYTIKDSAMITRLVNSLIAKGYVTKKPSPTDKRNNIITITEKGTEQYNNYLLDICKYINTIIEKNLESSEIKTAKKVLNIIINNLTTEDVI